MTGNAIKPPRIAWHLLRFLLRAQDQHAVIGDFQEHFQSIVESKGLFIAKIWYWGNVFRCIPSVLILTLYWRFTMILNYLKIAFRNMKRQKSYTFINIIGLAVGLACTFVIMLWVHDETTYDHFHENKDTIFQVVSNWKGGGKSATVPGQLTKALKSEIPEVIRASRIIRGNRVAMRYGEKAFYEDGFMSVDPDFFEMFSFKVIKGNPIAALDDPHGIILTESIARKYFENEDPIGEMINWNDWQDYQVKGIIEDSPFHSSLELNFIDSHQLGERFWQGGYNWYNFVHNAFVQVSPNAEITTIEKKMNDMLRQNNPSVYEHLEALSLKPLTDIHLDAAVSGAIYHKTPKMYVTIFATIASFILVIACINFMNLSTARASQRAKEVGLRKVVGSSKSALIGQFFGESLIYTFIAGLIAIILTQMALQSFESLFGFPIHGNASIPVLALVLISVLLITGILSGAYPALVLSSFRPSHVIKGSSAKTKGKQPLRKILVVFQFIISVFLIVGTLVVFKQLHFIRNQDMGFDQENIVHIPMKEGVAHQYTAFKQTLLSHSSIAAVTAKNFHPMNSINNFRIRWEGMDEQMSLNLEVTGVDIDYLETLGLKLIQGRSFSKDIRTDIYDTAIINEEAVRQMNLADPLGKWIQMGEERKTIVGIVQNEQYQTAMAPPIPRSYAVMRDWTDNGVNLMGLVLIKIQDDGSGQNIKTAINHVQKTWNKFNPQHLFEYHFLDQDIEGFYLGVNIIIKLITAFTTVAIIISCLGLFGLASFTIEMRTKEIGIRKVLGASLPGLLVMLSKEFLRWVLIASLIAWPIAYFIMNRWLQDFASHISVDFSIFLVSGLTAVLIALLSVGLQTITGAKANPTDALKYE